MKKLLCLALCAGVLGPIGARAETFSSAAPPDGLVVEMEAAVPMEAVEMPALDEPVELLQEVALEPMQEATLVAAATPRVYIYQDFAPWWGENRTVVTLLKAGLVEGEDFVVLPTIELVKAAAVPKGAEVVWISSNSLGNIKTREAINSPTAQFALSTFVSQGGVLVGALADNDHYGTYKMPGMGAMPGEVVFSKSNDVTWTATAKGTDGLFGTDDDHRLLLGGDGLLGGGDDLDDYNLDTIHPSVAHGYMVPGQVLPPEARVLATVPFNEEPQPVLAEYCLDRGLVIVNTFTMEWWGQMPMGKGPSYLLQALSAYTLSKPQMNACGIEVAIDIKPGAVPNVVNRSSAGVVPVAILGSATLDVTQIDPATVSLAGARIKMVGKSNKLLAHTSDINGDGYLDLVCQVETEQWLVEPGATTARLEAMTMAGVAVYGSDAIEVTE